MKKILVIDDDRFNLKFIFEILKVEFPYYKIILSESGIEGIKIANNELPDVILLDILMPEMDGFEVCNILKNSKSTMHIPILLVSALHETSNRIKGLNAGADAFISKPYDSAELKAQVKVLLRIKFAEDLLRERNANLEILIKKQTSAFQNIEERYSKVSEYALEYFWEVDQYGIFNYVSPVIVKILGFDTDETLGKRTLFDTYTHNLNKEPVELLSCIFERRENFTGNIILCSHKNGNNVWLSVYGFPIFDSNQNFSGYIGVSHDISRQREAEEANKIHLEKINNYQMKLKSLYLELSVAEEKERRRIALYLHDGIGQTLSLVNMNLTSQFNSENLSKTNQIIRDSVELLNNAIKETRTLTYELSPPVLFELGLVAAIRWKSDQVEARYGIAATVQSDDDYLKINDDNVGILLYRIISELLTNIIKHANADLIKIEIISDLKNLYISVYDNGHGFHYQPDTKSTIPGGFGLFSISERLDSVGGSLQFDSSIEVGTKAIVRIPL